MALTPDQVSNKNFKKIEDIKQNLENESQNTVINTRMKRRNAITKCRDSDEHSIG